MLPPKLLVNCVQVALVFSLFLQGCGGSLSERFMVSSGRMDGAVTNESKLAKSSVGGVTVIVRPDNTISIDRSARMLGPPEYRFSAAYADPLLALDANDPFVIEILFSTQSHAVTFDPMAIELHTNKGYKSHPIKVYNLTPRYSTTLSLSPAIPLCRQPDTPSGYPGFPTLSRYERKSPKALYLAPGSLYCIAIAFDIPRVDPRASFDLSPMAIGVDGSKFTVPEISFSAGVYTLFDKR